MKRTLFLILFTILVYTEGFTQTDIYPAVTTISKNGNWASGVEARGIYLDSKILSALYTFLSNSSEIDSVVKTETYICYRTGYFDLVYFILAQGQIKSRVMTISRVPFENIGMVKRLDNNMLQAARFYKSCVTGNDASVFNIFCGYNSKFYYTKEKGQYSRCYINQNVNAGYSISSYKISEGYLVIPKNAISVSIRLGSYNAKGSTKNVSVTIQDTLIVDRYQVTENEGFLFGTLYSGVKKSGTYKYSVTFYNGSFTYFEQFKVFFDCFGNDMNEPITIEVNGNPQTTIQSRTINELIIPK